MMKETKTKQNKEERFLRFSEADVMKYASLLYASYATEEEAREILSGEDCISKAALYKGHLEKTLQEPLDKEQIKQLRQDTKTVLHARSLVEYCKAINNNTALILLYGLRVTTFEKEYHKFCYILEANKGDKDQKERELGKCIEEATFFSLKIAAESLKSLILALANLGECPYYIFFTKRTFTSTLLRLYDLEEYFAAPSQLYDCKNFKELSLQSLKVSDKEILAELDFVIKLLNR